MVGLHSYAHVNVLELSHKVVHPARVGGRDIDGSERGSLNDHVVDGDL